MMRETVSYLWCLPRNSAEISISCPLYTYKTCHSHDTPGMVEGDRMVKLRCSLSDIHCSVDCFRNHLFFDAMCVDGSCSIELQNYVSGENI